MTDEQRHDEVGYASGGHFETPCLDALAGAGAAFETAYSPSTVCVPSRASLLTGLLHHRVPTEENGLALREGYFTLAHALRAAGYQTALVGKMHFSPMYARHGFDVMKLSEHLVPFSGYPPGSIDDYHRFLLWQGRADARATHMFGHRNPSDADAFSENHSAVKFPYEKSLHPIGWIASTAIRVLEERKPDAPLFLVVSFPRPHSPYDPAEPYASMYDPKDARLPPTGYDVNERLPAPFRRPFERDDRQRHVVQPISRIPEATFRHILTYVRALVRQIDDAMAEVLAKLDLDRTVVFFTSDHGTYGGHRGLLGKVPWLPFDDLARVPFACRAPGGARGLSVKTPVQSSDFVATCLDYAGIEPPPGVLDSVSLRGVLEGRAEAEERPVFSATSMGWPMVRKGTLKLVRQASTRSEILFDLARDPLETSSLADDPAYAAPLEALRAALDDVMRRGIPPLEVPAAATATFEPSTTRPC